jgi:phosphoglycerate dehydrogenase-like enzyme
MAAPPELAVTILRQPDAKLLHEYLADAEFLISERVGVIDAEILRSAPQLKMVERLGSLTDGIDLEAAKSAGVAVCYWPQRGVMLVAEHLIMQMLGLAKRLREVEATAVEAGDWGESRRTDEDTFAYNWSGRAGIGGILGASVGILGFGEIGAELSRRLTGWGCTVRYHRRRRLPRTSEEMLGILYADRDELFQVSDFVVNLLPYFAETDHSIGAAEFSRMQPGAFFVSCGSGSIVDEVALADAVRSGRLGGAALDTYEWEPIRPDNPMRLLALEGPHRNVLLTPHTAAGAAPAGVAVTRRDEYEPILRYLRAEPIPNRLV